MGISKSISKRVVYSNSRSTSRNKKNHKKYQEEKRKDQWNYDLAFWKDTIDKPLARLIKEKKEGTQINKIRTERGKVTTDITEIQTAIGEYYEQYNEYSDKQDNLKEIARF